MNRSAEARELESSWLEIIEEQVGSLRYGIVQIVVHDRRVVQIERTEKIRLEKGENKSNPEK